MKILVSAFLVCLACALITTLSIMARAQDESGNAPSHDHPVDPASGNGESNVPPSPSVVAEKEKVLTAEEEVALGNEAMKGGDYKKAAYHYGRAIDKDPSNGKYFYKRAEARFSSKSLDDAYSDVKQALNIQSVWFAAHRLAGRIAFDAGKFADAVHHFEAALTTDPNHSECRRKVDEARECRRRVDQIRHAREHSNWPEALSALDYLIQKVPGSDTYSVQKIEILLDHGDAHDAVHECNRLLKINPRNLPVLVFAARAYWKIGTTDFAQNYLRKCLKFDPDYLECGRLMKHMKKVTNLVSRGRTAFQEGRHEESVTAFAEVQKIDPHNTEINEIKSMHCRALQHLKRYDECIDKCTSVWDESGHQDAEALLARGECRLGKLDIDEAIRDFRELQRTNPNDQRVFQALHRAENLRKQKARKNYYDILGVARDASQKDIKTAFRKQSMKWHPDKFSGDEKTEAEKRFREILEAYDILEDDKTRGAYDRGEDVDGTQVNPGEQQQQGFHGGGFPGGFGFPGGGFPGGGFPGGGFPGGGGGGGGGQRTFTFNFGGGHPGGHPGGFP